MPCQISPFGCGWLQILGVPQAENREGGGGEVLSKTEEKKIVTVTVTVQVITRQETPTCPNECIS